MTLKLIKYAELFAKDKHDGQFRSDDITPYWHHLRQVVHNLQTMGITDESILCAGWLHDTIEDTDTNFDSVSNSFGIEVAKIVSNVTKDTRLPKTQRDKNYIRQLLKSSWQSKVVKLGDIVANISDLKNSGFSSKKKVKQIKDMMEYFKVIRTGITKNKSKIPELQKIEDTLNELLIQYGQKPVTLV